MRDGARVAVIIPALNEEKSIGKVLEAIPSWADDVIVVDNGSTDRTAEIARSRGARVVEEPERGYGAACLAGIADLRDPDIIVFVDADYSDRPGEMDRLVDPILAREADLVIGSRVLGNSEPGAITPQARFGNILACALIRLLWKGRFTDLGPFRAIRASSLFALGMQDRDYGWTVEMQIKAVLQALRVREVPVSYHRRIGKSKISGTFRGVIGAGTKILFTIFRSAGRAGAVSASIRERVIVFTRYPEPGKTKTRLIPTLGAQDAADLHRDLTVRAVAWARRLRLSRPVDLEVRFEGGDERRMGDWLGPGVRYRLQEKGDLGERMGGALRKAFLEGMDRAVLVGTDIPAMNEKIATKALDLLNDEDLVFGPAEDGGYYLVGLQRVVPEIFGGIPWSTPEVLEATLAIAEGLKLRFALVDSLGDLDRPEDLHRWDEIRDSEHRDSPWLSIIIPALNEAENVADTIAAASLAPGTEIILVDGGSTDRTAELAENYGVTVLQSEARRARQMNYGAERARGEVLLFLHADTWLPDGYDTAIREALAEPDAVAGAFELHINAPGRSLRLIDRVANWRSRRLGMPYGDQGIFLPTRVFREAGGFPDLPLMEDYELMRRLRKRGRIVIPRFHSLASPRRWLQVGPWKTTAINQVIIIGYHLGVSPARLARLYWPVGKTDGQET